MTLLGLKALAYWLFFTSSIANCVELSENDIIAFAIALDDIAVEFFDKQGVEFEIFIDSKLSADGIDIVDRFLYYRNVRLTKSLIHRRYSNVYNDGFILKRSTFIFMETLDSFYEFDKPKRSRRYQDDTTKYIIVIPNLMFQEFVNIYYESSTWNSFLTLFSDGIYLNSYFLLNEGSQLGLVIFEWNLPEYCDTLQLLVVHAFVKDRLEWYEGLENHEKFLDYHGCELVMMLPIPFEGGLVRHVGGYVILNIKQTKLSVHGITPEIFKIAGEYHNFQPIFQPALVAASFIYTFTTSDCDMVAIKSRYKHPQVYFQMVNTRSLPDTLRMSHVFVNQKYYLVVTPAKAYTQYEKLALPFDVETWTMLLVTFIITVLTIIVVNRLSNSAQNVVYGERVRNPFWNVVSIFFGISQTRLPAQNFPRFILTLFIGFCLIFRTCFQSKFFEYMTSEPRRAPPKTVEDLIERNYTVYITPEHEGAREKLPNAVQTELFNFLHLFETRSQNDTADMALLVDELYQNFYENHHKENYDWNQLDDPLYLTYECIAFHEASFYYPMFKRLIDRLIETGVMNFLVENFYSKKIYYEKAGPLPKVLSLDDLSFGFTIWLGSCAVSAIAFLGEKLVGGRRPKYRIIKYAKVHPMEGAEDELEEKDHREVLRKFRVAEKTEAQEKVEDGMSTAEGVCSLTEPTEPLDELDEILEELNDYI